MVGVRSVKMRMFDGMVRTLLDVRCVSGLKKNNFWVLFIRSGVKSPVKVES